MPGGSIALAVKGSNISVFAIKLAIEAALARECSQHFLLSQKIISAYESYICHCQIAGDAGCFFTGHFDAGGLKRHAAMPPVETLTKQ